MIYEVTPGQITLDDLPTRRADILRCVQTLLGTVAGELAMDRSFGVTAEAVDMLLPAAQAAISGDIIRKVAKYEPRARVQEVKFDGNADGVLIPKVVLKIE